MRQQIGEGTTSRVFLAMRRSDRRPFACKVVDKRLLARDQTQTIHLLKQLRKEVDILQRLDHPNVIHFQDMIETKDKIYCFIEHVEGGELYDYLYENGPMDAEAAAEMLFGLMSAVAHMHERDVVHRDIKAENLMIVSDVNPSFLSSSGVSSSFSLGYGVGSEASAESLQAPRVKLIDFGFSTVLKLAPSHSFLGTPGYIAPEIRQDRSYYKGVDVWAVGILTYLVLVCRLPFDREISSLPRNSGDIRNRFALNFTEHIWERMPHVESAKELLRGMLHIEPTQRWNAQRCLRHPWLSGEVFGKNFAKRQQQQQRKDAALSGRRPSSSRSRSRGRRERNQRYPSSASSTSSVTSSSSTSDRGQDDSFSSQSSKGPTHGNNGALGFDEGESNSDNDELDWHLSTEEMRAQGKDVSLNAPRLPGMNMCVSVPHLETLAYSDDEIEVAQSKAGDAGYDGEHTGSDGSSGSSDGSQNGHGDRNRREMRQQAKGELSPHRMGNRAVSMSDLREGYAESRSKHAPSGNFFPSHPTTAPLIF